MSKASKVDSKWMIVAILFLIIILWYLSFGTYNFVKSAKWPDEFKDNLEEAKRKHKRLSEHLNKQQGLKLKLAKRFKLSYLIVRIVFIASWFGFLFSLFLLGMIHNLGDALNYSEAAILIFVIANFITFGTITNLEGFIHLTKTKIENWIYGKYIDIDEKIKLHKAEESQLAGEIALYESINTNSVLPGSHLKIEANNNLSNSIPVLSADPEIL